MVNDALETVCKGMGRGLEELEIGGLVDSIQTPALLGSARMLRRIMED